MFSVCCNYSFTNILFFCNIFPFFVHCLYVLGSPTHHIHNVNGGSHSNCISPQLTSARRMISRCQMVLLPIYRNNCIRRYCNASPLLSATVLSKKWRKYQHLSLKVAMEQRWHSIEIVVGKHCFSFRSAVCVDIWGFIQCFTMSTAPSSSKWQNVCTCTTTAEEEKAKTVLIFRFRWHIKEWVSRLNGTMARKKQHILMQHCHFGLV